MHAAENHQIVRLQAQHLQQIMQIAQEQFGQNFLSQSELLPYLDSPNKFCQVAISGQDVLGFSLMQAGNCEEIAHLFRREKTWFIEQFGAYERLGYRSLTAVAERAKRQGVADTLVRQGLAFLSDKVEVVVCDAWKSTTTHIANILERHGYEFIKECPDYWAADSLADGFICKACGQPPCRCTAVIYAKFFNRRPWWARRQLGYLNGRLHFAGLDLLAFASQKATPFYLYDLDRISHKYNMLHEALAAQNIDFQIYYAMKANRHPAILAHLRRETSAGIDVCSPAELDWAQQNGFLPNEISYTGTSLSDTDIAALARHPQIRINLDSLSAVRRFAKAAGEGNIGIRINPHVGMGYNQSLEYSGNQVVKFGIYREQWLDLQELIQKTKLHLDTVHCHAGSGFLTAQLPRLEQIFEQLDYFLSLFPSVTRLNMGGGLGVMQSKGDLSLDLNIWAAKIADYARRRGLTLAFEPGDFLVKDAGLLITQANTVETKKDRLFVGLDTGMNMNYEYAYYQMNLEAVPLAQPKSKQLIPTTLAGNINEPIDTFSDQKPLPPIQEGDYLALLNSGGYGASTASNHCMRGNFKEYITFKRK